MKSLIIHPEDSSTTFLEPVYSTVIDKTIIKGGITRAVLMELISSHDRIMMMGRSKGERALAGSAFSKIGKSLHCSSRVVRREYLPFLRLLARKDKGFQLDGVELEKEELELIRNV